MQPSPPRRDLALLPKAHLHLHFTGSLDVPTLRELAELADVPLPDHLVDAEALSVPATTRGWHRFQRSYDTARLVVTSEDAMRRVVHAAVVNDVREGSRRLELQIDPSSYAPHVGGLVEALEIVMDEAQRAGATYGLSVGVIVAASRMRHPMEAETLARLAARHAGDGHGEVVAFGLSNDEQAGVTEDWSHAFSIARRAGLPGVPHGGELSGPEHVRRIVDSLGPTRLGHGVRTVEDPALLAELISRGIAFEVCPTSNVHLGVYETVADVPLRTLVDAGATVALGADDPLLFFSRLTDQYELARDIHGFTDTELAALARSSIRASFASPTDKSVWLSEVDEWLATEPVN
jgi:adenosine deaminase